MAFGGWEFVRGALAAWLIFLVLQQIALRGAVLPLLPIVIPFTIVTLLVWWFPAFMLGQVMRRQSRVAWHVLAFFAYGAAIGYVTTSLLYPIAYDPYLHALCSGIAVALGWWLSAHHALAVDRRRAARAEE